MAQPQRFEDLLAWQKARELTNEIYRITLQPAFAKDFGPRDQIRRAAISVMSNIAEGFERSNDGNFQRFLLIANASCGEVRCQLYVAHDVKYIQPAEFDGLMKLSLETTRIISGLYSAVYKRWKN